LVRVSPIGFGVGVILVGMSDDGESAPKRVPGVKGVDPFGPESRARGHETRKLNIRKKAAEKKAVNLLTGDGSGSLADGAQAALQVLILRIVKGEQTIAPTSVAQTLTALHDIVRLENDRPTAISANLSANVDALQARMEALAQVARGHVGPIETVAQLESRGILPAGATEMAAGDILDVEVVE